MSWPEEGTRFFNGGSVEERTELMYPDTASDVAAQILRLAEGLENARVEFTEDPDPHGGFSAHYVSVSGRIPGVKAPWEQ